MISNLDALYAADIDSISRDEFRELKKAAEAELEAEMVILKAKIEAIESKFRRVDGARSALNPGFSEGDQSLIAVRPRKRSYADVVSAHPPKTREVTFLDLPQDIKNQILGPANLPDPADGANLRAVSRGMRDAVDATGRELKELKIDQALNFGNVRAVRRLMLERQREEGIHVRRSGCERTAWAAQVFTRGRIQMGQGHVHVRGEGRPPRRAEVGARE